MDEAQWVLWLFGGWLAVGVLVGIPFLILGLERVDPSAKGSWLFRPILLPGVAALWPIVALWWLRGRSWAEETP